MAPKDFHFRSCWSCWPIHPCIQFLPKWVGWPCPQKDTHAGFQLFFIMFCYIISHTSKLETYFSLLHIFLDFCTLCLVAWWFEDGFKTDPLSTLVLFVVVMRHCVTLQHFHYCIVRFSPIASRSNYFIATGFSESRKGYFDTLYALDGGKAPRSERPKAKVLIHK